MAKIYIPNLLEFIYDLFTSRTKDYLFDRLSREELKRVKSPGKTKTYVERGRLEDIAIMLSKINCGFSIFIWDKEKEKRTVVQDILIAQLEVDPKDLTRHLIKSKIFTTQSINIIRALQVTSKANHSQTWSVNRKFLEIGNTKFSHKNPRNLLNNFEAEKNLKWYVETIDTALNLPPLLEHHKIELCHLKILLYLFNCPNGATKESIYQKLNSPRGFRTMLPKLYKMNMIDYGIEDKNVISIGVNGLVLLDTIISKFP